MQAAGKPLVHDGTAAQTPPAAVRPPRGLTVVGVGLAVTLAQVLLACALAGTFHPGEAYQRLSQWDSKWYAWIAEHGYREPRPGVPEGQLPVGFFPGYPLAGRLVAGLTGLPSETAVILAAQLSCVGFWVYVLLWLRRMEIKPAVSALAVAVIAVHPCAFFLITGYSESLFLLGLLGFLYW